MRRRWLGLFYALGFGLLLSCSAQEADYEVVGKYPHDPNAYTQGLLFHDGYLYESTGLYGQSSLRKVDPETGQVLQQQRLDRRYFGEGLALVKGVLIQLTWQNGKAFVYNSDTFEPLGEFSYGPGTEGWGLTYDGAALIMSDGSERLYFRDPASFRLRKTLTVTENGRPVRFLNELEYIDGTIWANVYQTDDVVLIDPHTGTVVQRLSFSDLLAPTDRNGREDALNGIAYDPQQKRIFITGKFYSYLYEIRI